jgi:acid stress-induced BolA-like protein IbaG/YrbA
MLSNEDIEKQFKDLEDVSYVKVDGDGYHYQLTIVSDVFQGKSKVAKQQWVYSYLKEFISAGKLHAINMKIYTNEEWGNKNG